MCCFNMFTSTKTLSNILKKNIGAKSKLNYNISFVFSLHFVEALTRDLVPRAFPLENGTEWREVLWERGR